MIAGIIAAYMMIAYVIVPAGWVEYEHRHPAIDDTPGITTTGPATLIILSTRSSKPILVLDCVQPRP